MWCWYRQVTLTANAVYFLIAWPGGVREGRAAFATLSGFLFFKKIFTLLYKAKFILLDMRLNS